MAQRIIMPAIKVK